MASDPKKLLERAMEKLASVDEERKKEKNQLEEDRKNLVMGLRDSIMEMVAPLMDRFMNMNPFTREDITEAISKVKIEVAAPQMPTINIPEIKVPTINVPTPQVSVKPIIKLDGPVTVEGELTTVLAKEHKIDASNPIPVILTDAQGKPYHAGNIIQGGGLNRSKIIIQGVDAAGGAHGALVSSSGRFSVDVNSLPPGGLGGTQYNEDDAHSSGDTGTLTLAVRNDAGGALATTNGDYIPLTTDSNGALYTNISGFSASIASHLVTPSGQTIIDEGYDAAQIVSAARGTELNDGVVRVVHVADVGMSVTISGFSATVETHSVTPSGQSIVDEGWNAQQVVSAARGTEVNDGVLRVVHVSDVGMSVNISGFTASIEAHLATPDGDSIIDEEFDAARIISAAAGAENGRGVLRVVHVGDIGMSVTATQTGTWNVGTVTTITNSVAAALIDSSGVQYSSSNPVPIDDAGGSLTVDGTVTVDSVTNSVAVALVGSGGVQYSGSNPVPVGDAGGSLTIDGTVTVASITASSAVSLVDSGGVGYSGSNPVPVSGTVVVSSVTASAAVSLIDSTGVGYSGSNPVPVSDAGGTLTVDGTVTVGSITASAAVSLIDSTGVGYSGSNPVPAYLVASSANSVIAVGDLASDAADTGSSPLKIGGIARQANPTAVAAGDRVSATFDDLGRQVVVPSQVRDLRVTAYATLSTNTETTLLAGAASTFHDLVWIKFANTSSGAVTIDLRETTAGTIIDTYEVPGNGVVGVAAPIPIPQANSAGTWTVDYNDADLSSTTVYVSGLFIKEV